MTVTTKPKPFACFDIETAPIPLDELLAFVPEFVPPPHPGEFNPAGVKYGNTKDPTKRAVILLENQERHAAAVANYAKEVDAANAAAQAAFIDKAALDWATGRVVAIGVKTGNEPTVILGADDEAMLLGTFWEMVQDWIDAKMAIIGHNIFGFDLVFLTMRSLKLGVEVPRDVVTLGVGRYPLYHKLFVDTMQIVSFGKSGANGFVKLDKLGKFFGLGGKIDVDAAGNKIGGGDFARLWNGTPEEHALAVAYLTKDVELTAAVATKLLRHGGGDGDAMGDTAATLDAMKDQRAGGELPEEWADI